MTGFYRLALLVMLCIPFSGAAAKEPPLVVASIKPVHSLVTGIMQGVAEPLLLMDGSAPPWKHRPDNRQIKALASADLIIWSGKELEPLLGDAIARLPSSENRVFEILSSEEMKVLPARGAEGQRDAWFWLDSRNMLILLDEFTRKLIALDPDNSHRYARNRERMLEPLIQIDRQMEIGYKDVSGVPVFFYHDTHHYFEQAYAMRVAGTVASPPAAPTGATTGLLALKSWLAEAPLHCLFTEASLSEPHLDLLLANSGVTAIELDSIGSSLPPGPDLYIRLMRNNFNAISACVSASQDPKMAFGENRDGLDEERFSEQLRPGYVLMNQYGETVSHEDFAGRFQLISFGYTFCPDICPTTLSVVAYVMELLGGQARQVQPIFISVDPQRDTPEVLKRYAAYFHPEQLALSGSPEMTRRVAEKFRARYEKVPGKSGDPQRYSMDHTASLYLLGKSGEFITKFAYGLSAEEIAARLREYMQSFE